jgi:hypothetical protein
VAGGAGGIAAAEVGRKVFFFEKKKQKTFIISGAQFGKARLKTQKFFGSFFQKRTFFLFLV